MSWIVKTDMTGFSDEDRTDVAKESFLIMRRHNDGGLRETARFAREQQPLEVESPEAVIELCDFLHAYGLSFEIYEMTRIDLDRVKAKHVLMLAGT